MAYVEKRKPLSGSNFSAARMRACERRNNDDDK